jgi:hypothetical protein
MLLAEIATRLTSTGVALGMLPGSTSTNAWTVYKSFMPEKPDKAVAVIETSGLAPYPRFSMGQPSFQVRVRGAPINESTTAYPDARLRIEKIKANLHGMTPATLSPAYFAGVWAEQEPFSLGLDENMRPEFSVNFRALRVST